MNEISEKEEFLEEIGGRVDILQSFSLDRLKILNCYYDEIIKQKKKEIQKLKKQI